MCRCATPAYSSAHCSNGAGRNRLKWVSFCHSRLRHATGRIRERLFGAFGPKPYTTLSLKLPRGGQSIQRLKRRMAIQINAPRGNLSFQYYAAGRVIATGRDGAGLVSRDTTGELQ